MTGRRISRQALVAGLFLAILGLTFFCPSPSSACDETLLALLTSSDPSSDFSRGIRSFHQELSALGSALLNNQVDRLDRLLERVMTAWMEFSNRFSVTPPEVARNDPEWRTKMLDCAGRIGQIRQKTQAGARAEAHQLVLDLTGQLTHFFDRVNVSDQHRVFLQLSEGFTRLESLRLSGNLEGMRPIAASLTPLMESLGKGAGADIQGPFAFARESLGSLTTHIGVTTETVDLTARLLVKAESNYKDLRARLLMNEWFPPKPSVEKPETASPAVSPATFTAPGGN